MTEKHLPMTKWWNEIEAAMNPVIYDMPSVQTTLIMQISLKLLINVRDYGLKTVKQIWIQEIMLIPKWSIILVMFQR